MKRLVFILIAVAASTALALVAFIIGRTLMHPPRHDSELAVALVTKNPYVPDDRLGLIRTAGSEDLSWYAGKPIPVYYGEFGERRDTPTTPSTADAPLLVLGCSLTWGQGVPAEQTYPSLLSRRFGMDANNVGVSGTGTAYSALLLERLDRLRPKWVVYGLFEDHLVRNVRVSMRIGHPLVHHQVHVELDRDTERFVLGRDPVYELFGGMNRLVRRFYLEQYDKVPRSFLRDCMWTCLALYSDVLKIHYDDERWDRPEMRPLKMRALEACLSRMAWWTHQRQARLAIVWIPLTAYPQVLSSLPPDVARVLRSVGTDVIVDMSSAFNAAQTVNPDLKQCCYTLPGDGHFNALGHQLVAEELAKALSH